jgi:hypothetical protein
MFVSAFKPAEVCTIRNALACDKKCHIRELLEGVSAPVSPPARHRSKAEAR